MAGLEIKDCGIKREQFCEEMDRVLAEAAEDRERDRPMIEKELERIKKEMIEPCKFLDSFNPDYGNKLEQIDHKQLSDEMSREYAKALEGRKRHRPLIEKELKRIKKEMSEPGKSDSEIEELTAIAAIHTRFLDLFKDFPMDKSKDE